VRVGVPIAMLCFHILLQSNRHDNNESGSAIMLVANNGAIPERRYTNSKSLGCRRNLQWWLEQVVNRIGIYQKHMPRMQRCPMNGWKDKAWLTWNPCGLRLRGTRNRMKQAFASWNEPPIADPHDGWCGGWWL